MANKKRNKINQKHSKKTISQTTKTKQNNIKKNTRTNTSNNTTKKHANTSPQKHNIQSKNQNAKPTNNHNSSKNKTSTSKKTTINSKNNTKNKKTNAKNVNNKNQPTRKYPTRAAYRHAKKIKKIKQVTFAFILFLSILVFIYALLNIFDWNKDNEETKKITEDVSDNAVERPAENAVNVNPPEDKSDDYWDYIKMDMMSVDFNELLKKNFDTVGWIKVNGTNINYPVVQTDNNDYYLTHAYDKTVNDAGWIYADYRNNMVNFDKNTIIYGHGRLNNTMFGSLKNITNSSWYDNKDNYIIKFSTPTENTLWQVFSVYTIPVESYYLQTQFNSDEQYNEFLQTLKSRSVKNFSAKVNSNDKIITLSTCKDVAGTQRVVMHAKLIKTEPR